MVFVPNFEKWAGRGLKAFQRGNQADAFDIQVLFSNWFPILEYLENDKCKYIPDVLVTTKKHIR